MRRKTFVESQSQTILIALHRRNGLVPHHHQIQRKLQNFLWLLCVVLPRKRLFSYESRARALLFFSRIEHAFKHNFRVRGMGTSLCNTLLHIRLGVSVYTPCAYAYTTNRFNYICCVCVRGYPVRRTKCRSISTLKE